MRANQCVMCAAEMDEAEGQVCGACKVKNGRKWVDGHIEIDEDSLTIVTSGYENLTTPDIETHIVVDGKPHIFINDRELPECESYAWFESAIQEKAERERKEVAPLEDVAAVRAAMKQGFGMDIVSGSDMSKSKGVYTMGGIEPKPAYCSPKSTQYGHWLPYNPDDISTLGAALGALWAMIENTIAKHGKPRGLEWVVVDWKERGPIVPDEIDNVALPPGFSCTIGFKVYFDEAKP